MIRVLRIIAAVVIVAYAPVAVSQTQPLPADSLTTARRASAFLTSGHADSVLAMIPGASDALKASVRSAAETFATRAGIERNLIEERWIWRQGARQYWRTIETTGPVPEPIVVRWVFGASGRLNGLGVNLLSAVPPIDSVVRAPQ